MIRLECCICKKHYGYVNEENGPADFAYQVYYCLEHGKDDNDFNEWLERNDFNDRLTNDLDEVLIQELNEEMHREDLNIISAELD